MKNNRTTVKVCIAVVVAIITVKALNYYNVKQIHEKLTEVFDSVNQDMAIKQLSELSGMILEVKTYLSKTFLKVYCWMNWKV